MRIQLNGTDEIEQFDAPKYAAAWINRKTDDDPDYQKQKDRELTIWTTKRKQRNDIWTHQHYFEKRKKKCDNLFLSMLLFFIFKSTFSVVE